MGRVWLAHPNKHAGWDVESINLICFCVTPQNHCVPLSTIIHHVKSHFPLLKSGNNNIYLIRSFWESNYRRHLQCLEQQMLPKQHHISDAVNAEPTWPWNSLLPVQITAPYREDPRSTGQDGRAGSQRFRAQALANHAENSVTNTHFLTSWAGQPWG